MTDTPLVPGTPNAGEFAELLTNPDMAVPGILVVDGEDLPPDRTLGRMVRTKITAPTGYVKKDTISARRIVVVDKSQPELVPDMLKNTTGEERQEWIADLSRDIYINLLRGGDDGELGEMVREILTEDEECYDAEQGELVPGYHDPANNDDARPGEQRAYAVIAGS